MADQRFEEEMAQWQISVLSGQEGHLCKTRYWSESESEGLTTVIVLEPPRFKNRKYWSFRRKGDRWEMVGFPMGSAPVFADTLED